MRSIEIAGVTVIYETSKGELNRGALLIRVIKPGDTKETEVWIPKACISEDSDVYKDGDTGKLTLTEFIAIEKGLV